MRSDGIAWRRSVSKKSIAVKQVPQIYALLSIFAKRLLETDAVEFKSRSGRTFSARLV